MREMVLGRMAVTSSSLLGLEVMKVIGGILWLVIVASGGGVGDCGVLGYLIGCVGGALLFHTMLSSVVYGV